MEDQTTNPPAPPDERNFRPLTLDDFIGQSDLKKTLRLMLDSARKRSATLEHVAFYGGPGLGKTTLAGIIASEQGARLHELSGPSLSKPGDLAQVLVCLQRGDVLFLDEIHALKRELSELLYSAMEDFKVSIKPDGVDKPITLSLHPFTMIGATTDYGLLPEPMRARFGQSFYLSIYTIDELQAVVLRAADIQDKEYFTVKGRLGMEQWTDDDGTKHQKFIIIANSIAPFSFEKDGNEAADEASAELEGEPA